MGNDFGGLAYLAVAPLWLVALIYGIRSFKDWPGIMERWNERRRDAAQIEADHYARLDARSQRLEERCDRLEVSEEECRRELSAAKGRIAELEGYNIGRGSAQQEAAGIVAVERLADRKKEDK